MWKIFYKDKYPLLNDYIDRFADEISIAIQHDYNRWPELSGGGANSYVLAEKVKGWLHNRISWLNKQWSETTNINEISKTGGKYRLYDITGKKIGLFQSLSDIYRLKLPHGIYIVNEESNDGLITNRKVFL